MSVAVESVDGGMYPVVRPTDLEAGHGFGIVIARTPRQIEASFRADNFAGALLRKMGEADEDARRTFRALLGQARSSGAEIYLSVNQQGEAPLTSSDELWRSFELEVRSRLARGLENDQSALDGAVTVTTTCLSLVLAMLPVEELEAGVADDVHGLPEGARLTVEVNRYERSPANRASCLAYYGTTCQACGFDFSRAYGSLGEGFIEVHHRLRVSDMGAEYFVNPIKDLVPVCANCHAMLHRRTPPMTVEELRSVLRS
jgi:5-methylcytosine-specific restriction protein A